MPKKMLLLCLLTFLFITSLTGCQNALIKLMVPEEDDKLAREMIRRLHAHDLEFFVSHSDVGQQGENPMEIPERLYRVFGHGKIVKIEMAEFNTLTTMKKRTSNLTYQVEFPKTWYVVNVCITKKQNIRQVTGFKFYEVLEPLQKINALTPKNKGPMHYLMLTTAILLALFVVGCLVLCIRTPMKRKWLWVLIIFVGVGQFGFNWTTGQFQSQPFTVLLNFYGVKLNRVGFLGPWILHLSIPLGAIFFLIKRRKLLTKKPPEMPVELPGESDAGGA